MQKKKEFSIDLIKRYAKRKMITVVTTLVIAIISVIISCVGFLIEGIENHTSSVVGAIAAIIYVLFMLTAILLVNHFEKVRKRLINMVTKDNLKLFFKYFIPEQGEVKVDNAYYEIKDIFMYGLWNLKDQNPFLKSLFENDEEYDLLKIENLITEREILVASMFHCLTFEKNGIVYRNQKIYLNQDDFKKIICRYYTLYTAKKRDRKIFIKKCLAIENDYKEIKESARECYKGITNEMSRWQKIHFMFSVRIPIFFNNSESVKKMKFSFLILGMVGIVTQAIIYVPSFKQMQTKDTINLLVTVLYEAITIILLWIDVVRWDENKDIHEL